MTKGGRPEEMKRYLEGLEEVKEVHLVYGGYDLVVVVEVKGVEELGRLVLREIREKFPVEETLTLIVAD